LFAGKATTTSYSLFADASAFSLILAANIQIFEYSNTGWGKILQIFSNAFCLGREVVQYTLLKGIGVLGYISVA
jgi:hypothetical protein